MYRKLQRVNCVAILMALMLSACGVVSAKPYPVNDHSDDSRFYNRDGSDKGLSDISRFLWESLWNESAWPEALPNPEPSEIPDRVEQGIHTTYINHATVLIQVDGLNILTDPIWSERASPVTFAGPKRIRPPGVAIDDLPEIDLILISHNHYDHLDLDTLQRLWERDKPIIVTPLGNAALMARRGITAFARDWGESVGVREDVTVTVERVQHWSSRWSADTNRALWGGFTVSTPGGAIYFAGDCGYSNAFAATAAARGPYRLALLPVGAYEPRWFMKASHMNPAEAVQAFADLGADTAIGIHWGVWQLTDEGIEAPRDDLATALATAGIAPARFPALAPGEAMTVPPLRAGD